MLNDHGVPRSTTTRANQERRERENLSMFHSPYSDPVTDDRVDSRGSERERSGLTENDHNTIKTSIPVLLLVCLID